MMERIQRKTLQGIFAIVFVMQMLLPSSPGRGELRKVKIGERMPEFSLPDSNGGTFTYKNNRDKVTFLIFLPTSQRRIERALSDSVKVLDNLRENNEQLHFVGVISGPAAIRVASILPAIRGRDALDTRDEPRKLDSKLTFPILLDGSFQLWGRLGVIATPTAVIVGKDGKIQWIKAGYGYDFIPVVRAHLKQALGIAQEAAAEETQQVKTVTNDTVAARMQRHLQMAKILEHKGRIESAIGELRKAAELDPNSNAPILELGELLCRADRNQEALNVAEKIKATNTSDKARLLLISGWAKRQMGELETAEKLLLEAIRLNPASVRALFELGKIQQARGQIEKAMKTYYRALTLVLEGSERAGFSDQW